MNPNYSDEMINKTLNPTAVPLQGTTDVWTTLAMGLFNLETAAHEIRILARDWGVTLSIFSDQFEQRYADAYETNEATRRMVDKAIAEIEKHRLFFEVAETALTLPAYFAAKVSLTGGVEVQTELGANTTNPDRRYALKAPSDMRILTRRVATLDFGTHDANFPHSYTPPRYRVEVDGFWRRLKADAAGRDANGDQVVGRTWVRGHARWKDKPPKIGVVHVKTPITQSLERAREKADLTGGTVSLRF